MTTYKNRVDNIFIFSADEDNNILWEGDFDFCRIGYPNDYTKAYNAYVGDNKHSENLMSFNQFKDSVHDYDDETHQYMYDKYNRMVESLKDKIDMVDPSGGPYIAVGSSLNRFGFEDYIVEDFEQIDTGYKIITKKCNGCGKPGAIHKMSCPTQKATVFITDDVKAYYDQMDKEVHQNRGNLNI